MNKFINTLKPLKPLNLLKLIDTLTINLLKQKKEKIVNKTDFKTDFTVEETLQDKIVNRMQIGASDISEYLYIIVYSLSPEEAVKCLKRKDTHNHIKIILLMAAEEK